MASVGQLVAGVAHELNNPIGFVYSNVERFDDFVKRLRAILDVYRALPLADAEQARVDERWKQLKVDYALKYIDSMIEGVREGAERAVRSFAICACSRGRTPTSGRPWNLHEELESKPSRWSITSSKTGSPCTGHSAGCRRRMRSIADRPGVLESPGERSASDHRAGRHHDRDARGGRMRRRRGQRHRRGHRARRDRSNL